MKTHLLWVQIATSCDSPSIFELKGRLLEASFIITDTTGQVKYQYSTPIFQKVQNLQPFLDHDFSKIFNINGLMNILTNTKGYDYDVSLINTDSLVESNILAYSKSGNSESRLILAGQRTHYTLAWIKEVFPKIYSLLETPLIDIDTFHITNIETVNPNYSIFTDRADKANRSNIRFYAQMCEIYQKYVTELFK